MAKTLETIKLVASLEKLGRKTKVPIWGDLAYRIDRPSRQNVVVNLVELNKWAKKFKGKTLVVPGKILAKGELTEKVKIVAVKASAKAIELASKHGEIILMKDFVANAEKVKVSDLVIIK